MGAILFLPEIKGNEPTVDVKIDEDEEEKNDNDDDNKNNSRIQQNDESQNIDVKVVEEEENLSIWKQPQALLASLQYTQLGSFLFFCLFHSLSDAPGFLFILFEELIPLWFTATVHSGGLDFSPPQTGTFLLILGMNGKKPEKVYC